VLALIALGYKQIDAHKAVRDLQEKGEAKSAEGTSQVRAEENGGRKMICGACAAANASHKLASRRDALQYLSVGRSALSVGRLLRANKWILRTTG